jgi:hypothetical protein
MAHWWELWSPGLQALGGVVELVGAVLLAYEWWRSLQEVKNDADRKKPIFDKPRPRSITEISFYALGDNVFGNIYKNKVRSMRENDPERLEALIQDYVEVSKIMARTSFKAKIYLAGFLIIVFGVLLQVLANAIAWAGAYGIFG